ncbi:MAG: class I SAM-dependent methyltransferase [Chitinophagaceae bacterium]
MEKITHQNCPVCLNNNINPAFAVKDFTVTNEEFVIFNCNNCTARFTQNIPSQNSIGNYYKSNNYISHSDTKEGLISKLYHTVRNITLKSKRNLINKFTENKKGKLLDIGAGTGAFAFTMQQNGWQITALEPDETAVEVALTKHQLVLQPLENFYQLPQSQYQAITLWHVLEHVHELQAYFKKFTEILATNGTLFIAVPNYTSFDADWFKEYWAAYDVPRHLYHFSPSSMQHLAEMHGFKIIQQKRMWFDSFYVSMLSTQYQSKKINYLIAAFVGICSSIASIFHKEKCSSLIYILQKK